MVRARATNRTTASIPFGAAHRVYFDTPPLQGWRSLPIGSEWEHAQNEAATRYAVANGINTAQFEFAGFGEGSWPQNPC
jgi:hypothetical protein